MMSVPSKEEHAKVIEEIEQARQQFVQKEGISKNNFIDEYLEFEQHTINLIASLQLELCIIHQDNPPKTKDDEIDFVKGIIEQYLDQKEIYSSYTQQGFQIIKRTFNYYLSNKITQDQSERYYNKWLSLKQIKDQVDILSNTKYNRLITNIEFTQILYSYYSNDPNPQENIKQNVLLQLDFIYSQLNNLLTQKMGESKLLLKQNPQSILELLDKFYQYFDENYAGYIKSELFLFLYFSLVEANLLKKPLNALQIQQQLADLCKEFNEFEGKISMRYFKLFFYNKRLISQNIIFELIKSAEKQILFFLPFKQKLFKQMSNRRSLSPPPHLITNSIEQTPQTDRKSRNNPQQNSFTNQDFSLQIPANPMTDPYSNNNQLLTYQSDSLQSFPNTFDISFSKAYQIVQERQNLEKIDTILSQSPIAQSVYYCLRDNYSAIIYWVKLNGLQLQNEQLQIQMYSIYKSNYMASFLNPEGNFPQIYQKFVTQIILNFLKVYILIEKDSISYYLTGGFINQQNIPPNPLSENNIGSARGDYNNINDNHSKQSRQSIKRSQSPSHSPSTFTKMSPSPQLLSGMEQVQSFEQLSDFRQSLSDSKYQNNNLPQYKFSLSKSLLKPVQLQQKEGKGSYTFRDQSKRQYSPVREYIYSQRNTTPVDPSQLNPKLKLKYKDQYIYQKLNQSKSAERARNSFQRQFFNQGLNDVSFLQKSEQSPEVQNGGITERAQSASRLKQILNSHQRINHLSSYQQSSNIFSPYGKYSNSKNTPYTAIQQQQQQQPLPMEEFYKVQPFNIYGNGYPKQENVQEKPQRNQVQFVNYQNMNQFDDQYSQHKKVNSDSEYSHIQSEIYNFSFSPLKQNGSNLQQFSNYVV